MASNSFVISRQYGSNEAPGKRAVKLDATVSVGIGNMIVEVAGYGQLPAAANAATGHMAGMAGSVFASRPSPMGPPTMSSSTCACMTRTSACNKRPLAWSA